jgi:hypothetical protein
MSERFQIGDIVECVTSDEAALTLGALYTIAAVEDAPYRRHARRVFGLFLPIGPKCPAPQTVDVTEVQSNPNFGLCGCCFRKIHRPRADFLTELLTAPVDMREDA